MQNWNLGTMSADFEA